ncbi:MAG: nucleoside deaminase [Pyrinomonadaceae bacterium]
MPQQNVSLHEPYMRRCLELAQTAGRGGDTLVGALIVRGDQILVEAFEEVIAKRDISGHAELIVVRLACRVLDSKDLTGCKLYTTAEPCFMCSYVIRQTLISEVIIGAPVGEVGGLSSRYPILRDADITKKWSAPPRIVRDVLRNECEALRRQS